MSPEPITPTTEFVVVVPYLDDGEKVGVGRLFTAAELGEHRAFVMEQKGWIARTADVLDDEALDDEGLEGDGLEGEGGDLLITAGLTGKDDEKDDASELVAFGFSKAILKLLNAAGLTTREAIVAYAQQNDGLSKAGLGPVQEETVFERLGGETTETDPTETAAADPASPAETDPPE